MIAPDTIYVDGRFMTVAEFQASHGLHVGKWLSLRGTTVTALPKDLHVDGLLDLRGTPITELPESLYVGEAISLNKTQITNILTAGEDSDGFIFRAAKLRNGWRILAGCRNFSLEEARAHWGPGGESDRPDCLALVEKLAEMIAERETAYYQNLRLESLKPEFLRGPRMGAHQ